MLRPESDFTRPRPDCPRPERWHATDAYATEVEVTALVAAMVTALQPDFVVETGTHIGNTAEAIGRALLANGHGRLVTLEVNAGLAAGACKRCEGLPVEVVCGHSLAWSPPQPIDFAWLDSDSLRRHEELRALLPWMHERTVIGVHDTGPQHPVRGLLATLESEGLISPLYLPTPRGVCFTRVNI